MTDHYSNYEDLKSASRRASDPYRYETISYKDKSKYESDGWVIHRKNVKSLRMKILKDEAIYFQDRVWNLFVNYQPEYINKEGSITLVNHSNDKEIIDVDVDYIEDEVRILSRVFSGDSGLSKLKLYIKEIADKKPTLSRSLSKFDDKKRKVGLVVWTDDLKVVKSLQDQLDGYGVIRLKSTQLDYFHALQKQLGVVSKYQFFAKLFAGQTIPELNNRVPAIKGVMGGHTYYSFSIEPETLLKLSYVLHRVNTSDDNVGAYQRMIKKKRVEEITSFLDKGGFFPNSIIINIDTKNKKPLKWDNASSSEYTSRANLGVLRLPKKYRSAFIIDGQHRLYGYGGSRFRFTNTIPVVAFENLPSEIQSKLFVEINHKQKSVPRNVLLALDSELKWNSPDADSAVAALNSRLVQLLGSMDQSPLNERIVLSEEQGDVQKCITRAYFTGYGLNRAKLFAETSKGQIITKKPLFAGDLSDKSLERALDFFIGLFDFVRAELPEQWEAGKGPGGFIAKNIGVAGLIQIVGDIFKHEQVLNNYDYSALEDEVLLEIAIPYIQYITDYLGRLSPDELQLLGKNWGSTGPTKIRYEFQYIINQNDDEFVTDGLEEYKQERSGQYNQQSINLIRDLQESIKSFVFGTLQNQYHDEIDDMKWWRELVSQDIQMKCASRKISERSTEPEYNYIDLIDYKDIILKNAKILLPTFTRPGEEGVKNANRLSWLVKVNDVRKKTAHIERGNIKREEFILIQETVDWLMPRL